jgi:hypothetical protein
MKIVNHLAEKSVSDPLYNAFKIDFPMSFIQSNSPKFISVMIAKYFNLDEDIMDAKGISVCSDIIQEEKYADSFLCFCNEASINKRIPIFDSKAVFHMWFREPDGKILDLNPEVTRVVVELLLEY